MTPGWTSFLAGIAVGVAGAWVMRRRYLAERDAKEAASKAAFAAATLRCVDLGKRAATLTGPDSEFWTTTCLRRSYSCSYTPNDSTERELQNFVCPASGYEFDGKSWRKKR